MSHQRQQIRVAIAVAAAAVAGALVPATAHAAVPISRVTQFVGQVNGLTVGPVIRVACVGPGGVGRHPVGGQTVSVKPGVAQPPAQTGFTGFDTQVAVTFGNGNTTSVVLTDWGVTAYIPGSVVLPCSGTGTVTFTPVPNPTNAVAATVTVTYQDVGF
jgi:hypothetical protein